MGEYLLSVVAVSMLSALMMFITYGNGCERAVRAGVSVILIYSVSMPIIGFVCEFDVSDISFSAEYEQTETEGRYIEVAEEAFCDGIVKMIAEKFDLKEENIKVSVKDFDFKNMRAGHICVALCGAAAMADTRSVAALICESGLGDCEVNIGFEVD